MKLSWMNFLSSILLATIVISGLMLSTGGLVQAQEENATTTSEPKFLVIQHAESGSISEINATAYTLELNDVSDKTILFSDRPDRIVTSIKTSSFIGNWTTGPDNFAADAPNAVLVLDDDEERQEIAIIELFNPVYDNNASTLKYDIVSENATSIELPSEFGQSTLVIDESYPNMWCIHGVDPPRCFETFEECMSQAPYDTYCKGY